VNKRLFGQRALQPVLILIRISFPRHCQANYQQKTTGQIFSYTNKIK